MHNDENETNSNSDEFSDEEYVDATYDTIYDNMPMGDSSHNSSWTAPPPESPITQTELRKKIQEIHADRNIDAKEKAKAIQVCIILTLLSFLQPCIKLMVSFTCSA
jgi:hypothetical protein